MAMPAHVGVMEARRTAPAAPCRYHGGHGPSAVNHRGGKKRRTRRGWSGFFLQAPHARFGPNPHPHSLFIQKQAYRRAGAGRSSGAPTNPWVGRFVPHSPCHAACAGGSDPPGLGMPVIGAPLAPMGVAARAPMGWRGWTGFSRSWRLPFHIRHVSPGGAGYFCGEHWDRLFFAGACASARIGLFGCVSSAIGTL